MDVRIETDARGRFVCTLDEGGTPTVVTSSDVPAAGQALLEAVESVADAGVGECTWREPGGEYRWLFKREGDRVVVVVLWSSGTLTGWQHVFRAESDSNTLLGRLRAELAIQGITGH